MSVLMVIIDGAEGSDYEGLSFVKTAEAFGLVNNTPLGLEVDSLVCITSMLGVSPQDIPTGRAYLELLASGNDMEENDIVFRCNGVEIEQNTLCSSCVAKALPVSCEKVRMISLGGYKNLLVLKNGRTYFDQTRTAPPHNHISQDINPFLPQSANADLQQFLRKLITEHHLWAWGQAVKTRMPTFYELHKQSGAIVCKTEIVKGIAKAMGLFCPDIKNATAEIDTDLGEKAKIARKLTDEYNLTILHINGADEAAHRRDRNQKREFMRRIDSEVVTYLLENLPQETALMVLSDHATDVKTGKHQNEPVHYYIFNQNEECDRWLKRL